MFDTFYSIIQQTAKDFVQPSNKIDKSTLSIQLVHQ